MTAATPIANSCSWCTNNPGLLPANEITWPYGAIGEALGGIDGVRLDWESMGSDSIESMGSDSIESMGSDSIEIHRKAPVNKEAKLFKAEKSQQSNLGERYLRFIPPSGIGVSVKPQ